MLEVLVAMVLLSIGLLGVARLQMFGLQNTGNAYFRTQASGLLTELVERVRANPQGALDNAYKMCMPPSMPSCAAAVSKNCVTDSDCSVSDLAKFDMYTVSCGLNGGGDKSGVDDLLPKGQLRLCCTDNDATPQAAPCIEYTASINWTETNDDDADGAGDTHTISMTFTP